MSDLKSLRDEDLLHQLSLLVGQSRGVEADVVAHIGEVELRRLYAKEACSSMFEYCQRVLRLRENEAYLRITVARAARENPDLLEMLRDGRLHLSGIARLRASPYQPERGSCPRAGLRDVPSRDLRACRRARTEARRRHRRAQAARASRAMRRERRATRCAPS